MEYSKIRKLCMNSNLKIVQDGLKTAIALHKSPTDKYFVEIIQFLIHSYRNDFATGLFPFWTEEEFKQTERFVEELKSLLQ